jgi:hypothetical protein
LRRLTAGTNINQEKTAVKSLRKQSFLLIAIWILITLALHLAWEILQLRYYTIWNHGNYQTIASAVLHCTLGDGLISAALWFAAGALLRNWRWLCADIWRGGMLVWPLGLAYTAWSEWRNVYVLGSWQYADMMPLLAGIGLLPLLQWILVPPISWLLFRHLATRFSAPPG